MDKAEDRNERQVLDPMLSRHINKVFLFRHYFVKSSIKQGTIASTKPVTVRSVKSPIPTVDKNYVFDRED